jgi:hypothetical protein
MKKAVIIFLITLMNIALPAETITEKDPGAGVVLAGSDNMSFHADSFPGIYELLFILPSSFLAGMLFRRKIYSAEKSSDHVPGKIKSVIRIAGEDSHEVSVKAKELNTSRGEIFLTERLKYFERKAAIIKDRRK